MNKHKRQRRPKRFLSIVGDDLVDSENFLDPSTGEIIEPFADPVNGEIMMENIEDQLGTLSITLISATSANIASAFTSIL